MLLQLFEKVTTVHNQTADCSVWSRLPLHSQVYKQATVYLKSEQLMFFVLNGTIYLSMHEMLRLQTLVWRYNWTVKSAERQWQTVGLMLGHRLRRWPNIKPTSLSMSRVCWVASLRWIDSGVHASQHCPRSIVLSTKLFYPVFLIHLIWAGISQFFACNEQNACTSVK